MGVLWVRRFEFVGPGEDCLCHVRLLRIGKDPRAFRRVLDVLNWLVCMIFTAMYSEDFGIHSCSLVLNLERGEERSGRLVVLVCSYFKFVRRIEQTLWL